MNQAFLMGHVKEVGDLKRLPENFITEKVLCFKITTKSTLKKWIGQDVDIVVNCVATSSCSGQLSSLFKMPSFSGRILLIGHIDVLEELGSGTHFIVDDFEVV